MGEGPYGARLDSQLLSDIEHRTFSFYWERVNHSNGLMADRWSTPAACSIAGTGFALVAWPIGVVRGWITRNQARDITLRTLRFFEQLPQGEQRSGTAGYRGFYYHLIDRETGLRLPDWELSTIDTCWLQMGMAFAQGWFDQEDEKEKEIHELAQRLLDRTEWDWMQANSRGGKAISMGWHPAFSGRSQTGLAQKTTQSFAAQGEALDLAKFFAKVMIVETGIGGARQMDDVLANPGGQAEAGPSAVGVRQSRLPVLPHTFLKTFDVSFAEREQFGGSGARHVSLRQAGNHAHSLQLLLTQRVCPSSHFMLPVGGDKIMELKQCKIFHLDCLSRARQN